MNPANNAVQIVLNSQSYVRDRPANKGGGSKDFFAGDDAGFAVHKQQLLEGIQKIGTSLAASRWGKTGYVRLKLRPDAWAKTRRPTRRLFRPEVCQSVGADAIGELIFEVDERALGRLTKCVKSAEEIVRSRPNKLGQMVPRPSSARCETGAIEELALVVRADKQKFSPQFAIDWFKQDGSAPFYVVDLFALPRDRDDEKELPDGRRRLLDTFLGGLAELSPGVAVARSRLSDGRDHRYLFIKLVHSGADTITSDRIFSEVDKTWSELPSDHDLGRHSDLLAFLSKHPFVRRVHLPPIVRQHLQDQAAKVHTQVALPKPASGPRWPKVGIVDGGISPVLKDWTIGRDGLVRDKDQDHGHGTFIAGLLVAGRAAGNTEEVAREFDGCLLYDVDIFPDRAIPDSFEQYHPNGFEDFLLALDSAVATAKVRHQVRIFNLSINVLLEVDGDKYSLFAGMLDDIARKNDVIIVISAGNLERNKMRGPWPADPKDVLAYLYKGRHADKLLQPAESVYAVTVTAVNPPDMSHPCGAPTSYTRCGPGMEVGVKPDFAHYSGAQRELLNHHGLFSIDPSGYAVTNQGTSFAAPLVAKTLATLESRIVGHVPRETLLALMVHHAQVPDVLGEKDLKEVARHFVGFGIPAASAQMLATPDSAITMVFTGNIGLGQWLEFEFAWPHSLVQNDRCMIDADMTLVYRPFIDPRFSAEFVRVNLDALLLQHDPQKKQWKGELHQAFMGKTGDTPAMEKDLIAHGLKWWPVKHYHRRTKEPIGRSGSWKLRVQSLLREGEFFPDQGVPFSVVLTLRDPEQRRPIFREMRQWLVAHEVTCGDVTAGLEVRTRTQGKA